MTGLEISVLCLALNIYFEARGEPYYGQMAVALVTLNRARAKKQSICEVVYEPYQFSWTLELKKPPVANNKDWIKAQQIAVDSFTTKDFTKGAYWFHRYDITPWWKWNKQITGKWGNHIFYKCKPKHYCNWR